MKKKKSFVFLSAFLLSVSFVLTGCGGGGAGETTVEETKESAEEAGTEAADDQAGGKSSKSDLVIAMKGDIKQIGYAQNGRMISSLVAPTLFNCIVTDDGSYEYVIENSIVDSYEWNEDYTAITLTLKEGVPMHDGTVLDAEDVVYSIKHTDEFGSVSGYNIVFEEVKALESNVVYVPFLSANIGNWKDVGERMIYSKEAAEASGDFAVFTQSDTFAGYGPYQVAEWNAGDSIVLKKFDDYYGGNDSPITDVIVRRIDEDTTAFSELQTGGVNMILYPTQYDIDDVKNGVYEEIRYQTAPGLYQQLFVFNLDAGSACADVRVRQAICYAIDKEAMWKGAFESSGYLANTPASMTQEFMEEMPDPYPFDLDKAKELFEEAGYGEGSTLICCVDNDTYRTTAYEMLKNNLAKIGITLDVKTGDNATYLGYVTGGVDWDLEIGLVVGEQVSMLIDNGFGDDIFEPFLSLLTDRPVIAVATHVHPDHTSGSGSFEEVWIGAEEEPMLKMLYGKESYDAGRKTLFGKTKVKFLSDGQEFDLGGRMVTAIHTPGHTWGSFCFYDSKSEIMMTGDTMNQRVFLQCAKPTIPLRRYRQSLCRIMEFHFEKYLGGHHPLPIKRAHIDHMLGMIDRFSPEKAKPYIREGMDGVDMYVEGRGYGDPDYCGFMFYRDELDEFLA